MEESESEEALQQREDATEPSLDGSEWSTRLEIVGMSEKVVISENYCRGARREGRETRGKDPFLYCTETNPGHCATK